MATTTTPTATSLAALLAARPTHVRTNDADTMRLARIEQCESTSEPVNIMSGEFYTRGDNRGEPMAAQDVRNTYNRKYSERLQESHLVIHVISWDENGNVLADENVYALLAPVA